MPRWLVAIPLIALLNAGCTPECDPPSRLDGVFSVKSAVTTSESEWQGMNLEAFDPDDVFISGWAEWTFEYIPSKKQFDLDIDGQPMTATYNQDSEFCEEFELRIDGTWIAEEAGTYHYFEWRGDLELKGGHFEGSYTYADEWIVPGSSESGSVTISKGSVTANSK